MKVTSLLTVASIVFLYTSCRNADKDYDASGAFESVETIVSTESSGTLMQFDVEEGQTLNKNQWIGYVDSFQLSEKKQQLEAQIASTTSQ